MHIFKVLQNFHESGFSLEYLISLEMGGKYFPFYTMISSIAGSGTMF